ncbi:MAG: HAAS signaling domain-containing protein [Kosmotogaceae bacterium]
MKALEKYLEEVKTYLVVDNPKKREDLLMEIKSHIIEKAENKYGKADEESVKKVIEEYGTPREVGSRYSEEKTIIAPHYKNYLFMYTGIAFAIHLGLRLFGLIASTLGNEQLSAWEGLLELVSLIPTTFIFDFGLVALILYFVTKYNNKAELASFSGLVKKRKDEKLSGKIFELIISIAGAIAFYYFMRFGPVYISESGAELSEVAFNALEIIKFAFLIGFGLMVINSVSAAIKLVNNSELVEIIFDIVGIIYLYLLLTPAYIGGFASFAGVRLKEINLVAFKGFAVFVSIILVISLVFHVIRYWARKIMKE